MCGMADIKRGKENMTTNTGKVGKIKQERAKKRKSSGKTSKTSTRQKKYPNLKKGHFTSDNQPSPESKKKGRDERKKKQKLQEMCDKYDNMTKAQLETLYKDPGTPAKELRVIQYTLRSLEDDKMIVDHINRVLPYAPKKTEVELQDKDNLRSKLLDSDIL